MLLLTVAGEGLGKITDYIISQQNTVAVGVFVTMILKCSHSARAHQKSTLCCSEKFDVYSTEAGFRERNIKP